MERALIFLLPLGMLVFQNHQLIQAREEVRTLRAERENQREVVAFHRSFIERQQAQIDYWRRIEGELHTMENQDAPLSPYLRAVLDRVQ